jgi:hypothetical protein
VSLPVANLNAGFVDVFGDSQCTEDLGIGYAPVCGEPAPKFRESLGGLQRMRVKGTPQAGELYVGHKLPNDFVVDCQPLRTPLEALFDAEAVDDADLAEVEQVLRTPD